MLEDKDDLWIDAIPLDPYSLCPCGCGKKWKFAKENAEEHENKFKVTIVSDIVKNCNKDIIQNN